MTFCGCKGVRYCAECQNTDRVLSLKSEWLSQPVTDAHPYCIPCSTALPCPHNPNSTCKHDLSGLSLHLDFISPGEERDLVHSIDQSEWLPSQSGRLKQDYGPRANYKKRKLRLDKFRGLPSASLHLRERLVTVSCLRDFIPVEQCNLSYHPDKGSSIDFHHDDMWLWGERLVIVNLLSDSHMLFSCEEGECHVRVPLPRRSLIVMSGEGRYAWKHAIARQDIVDRRISVTFRELSQLFLLGDRSEEGRQIVEIAGKLV